jgi:excisionase family DNA binding protein
MPNFEPLISVPEAAKLLQIHQKTVQKMCRSGALPAMKFGKYWRFRRSVLDLWVKERLSSTQSRRAEER